MDITPEEFNGSTGELRSLNDLITGSLQKGSDAFVVTIWASNTLRGGELATTKYGVSFEERKIRFISDIVQHLTSIYPKLNHPVEGAVNFRSIDYGSLDASTNPYGAFVTLMVANTIVHSPVDYITEKLPVFQPKVS